MGEKTVTLSTDHDAALLLLLQAFTRKCNAEAAMMEQQTKTLKEEEKYYSAQASLAALDLKIFDGDQETMKLRIQNYRMRVRQENRDLQRQSSMQGRKERKEGEGWREGTRPVAPRREGARTEKPNGKGNGLTHHMDLTGKIPADNTPAAEAGAA